jgi:hypothetical protein
VHGTAHDYDTEPRAGTYSNALSRWHRSAYLRVQRTLAQARSADVYARTRVPYLVRRPGIPHGRFRPIPKEVAAMSANGTSRLRYWFLLAALPLTGCGRAPSFDILGSFFPAWLLCFVAARRRGFNSLPGHQTTYFQ